METGFEISSFAMSKVEIKSAFPVSGQSKGRKPHGFPPRARLDKENPEIQPEPNVTDVLQKNLKYFLKVSFQVEN